MGRRGAERRRRSLALRQRPLERRVLPSPAGEIYVGGGIWHPEKPWIDAFRRRVADEPAEIIGLVAEPGFRETFGSLSGEGHALLRVPAGFPPDHPAADVLRLKDVVFGRRLADNDATSPALPDLIADTFVAAMPVLRYLAAIG